MRCCYMSRENRVAGWWLGNAGTIYIESLEMIHPSWRSLNLRTIELNGPLWKRGFLTPTRNSVVHGTPSLAVRFTTWVADTISVRHRQDPNLMNMRLNEHWLACVLRSYAGSEKHRLKDNSIQTVAHDVVREGTEHEKASVQATFNWAKRQESKHTQLVGIGWRISLWWLERGTIIEQAYFVGFAPPREGATKGPSFLFDVGADKDALVTCHNHVADVDTILCEESRWVGPVVVTLMKVNTYEIHARLLKDKDRQKAEVEDHDIYLLAKDEGCEPDSVRSRDIPSMASKRWQGVQRSAKSEVAARTDGHHMVRKKQGKYLRWTER